MRGEVTNGLLQAHHCDPRLLSVNDAVVAPSSHKQPLPGSRVFEHGVQRAPPHFALGGMLFGVVSPEGHRGNAVGK